MRKIIFLVALLVGCTATSSTAYGESIWEKRCIEVTPDVVAAEAAESVSLEILSSYLEGERLQLISYLTFVTGSVTNVTFESRAFVNNYSLALVHARLDQRKKHVGDMYMLLAQDMDSNWSMLGMFTSGQVKDQINEENTRRDKEGE